ncbi:MAG: hypothetical protein Q4Q53_04070 [Methanocorpusculum sp.]|nr:hypothetical protein [Methanocorpusculum sp.]
MKVEDLFRVDERLRNGLKKYYLVCELFSSSKKFAVSHLIKTGTKPTKSEIIRSAGLFGFDLETNTIDKAAKYSSEIFNFDKFASDDDFYEIEKYKYLTRLFFKMTNEPPREKIISKFHGITFSENEISKMFESGKIPDGKFLPEVNLIQNLNSSLNYPLHKKITLRSVEKIRERLYNNFDVKEFDSGNQAVLENIISEFNKKISENYHPLEQCIILSEALFDNFQDRILASFILCRTALVLGYFVTPDISSWENTVEFIKSENEVLEKAVRKKISSEFKVASGARQRQLDCF